MGSLAQKLTVLGLPLFSVQLALFSAKCPKLRIFHTTGSCLGDNSEPESINRNYIYLTSGLSAGFSRTTFFWGFEGFTSFECGMSWVQNEDEVKTKVFLKSLSRQHLSFKRIGHLDRHWGV